MDKVRVRWVDSSTCAGWVSMTDAAGHRPCAVDSVGYVASESETHITLVMSTASNGNVLHAVAIPKCAIETVVQLQ